MPRLLGSLVVCVLSGCVLGSGVSFQAAYQAALPKAQAWASDARVSFIDGGGINSDGKTSALLGQWVFDFRAASKPGMHLLVTDLAGKISPVELPATVSTDPIVIAEEQADIDALAAWGESSDSPRWFKDAHWPSGATLVIVSRFCNRQWQGMSAPCPFENDAIVAQNSSSSVAVELYPTPRNVTVVVPNPSDGGTNVDLAVVGGCNPAHGKQDCNNQPNCDPDTRRCGDSFSCFNDQGCSGLMTICDPLTSSCWHSCYSDAQCAGTAKCNLTTYRCQ